MTSIILALVVAVSALAAPQAPPARTLGDFTVAQLDGQAIASSAMAKSGRWVLVYVKPRCASCDQALAFWRGSEADSLAARTVVVVGRATAAEAQALRTRMPHLAGAPWYVDAPGAFEQAMHASGAPASFGLEDQRIEWTLQGALPVVRTVVVDWLTR